MNQWVINQVNQFRSTLPLLSPPLSRKELQQKSINRVSDQVAQCSKWVSNWTKEMVLLLVVLLSTKLPSYPYIFIISSHFNPSSLHHHSTRIKIKITTPPRGGGVQNSSRITNLPPTLLDVPQTRLRPRPRRRWRWRWRWGNILTENLNRLITLSINQSINPSTKKWHVERNEERKFKKKIRNERNKTLPNLRKKKKKRTTKQRDPSDREFKRERERA